MSYHTSRRDMLVDLTSLAFLQARVVNNRLSNTAIPVLAAQRRLFVEKVMQDLTADNLFDEGFLRDLAALIAALETEVEVGSYVAWVSDECSAEGGYEHRYRDQRAQALATVAIDIRTLVQMIEAAMAAIKAARLSDDLMQV